MEKMQPGLEQGAWTLTLPVFEFLAIQVLIVAALLVVQKLAILDRDGERSSIDTNQRLANLLGSHR